MPSSDQHRDDSSRNREAIADLLDQFGGTIYGLCLRLTGRPDEAEDLMQETFLQAQRKWGQFRGESSPSTWLYTIATRKFLRMQRKRSGEPRHIPSLAELMPMSAGKVPYVPTVDETPLDASLQKEALRKLESAIVELPAMYRMPLVLKEIVGFSVTEVAGILGLRNTTVKTRLHRGRLMIFKTVTSVLPKKEVPPSTYTKRVCLDLLLAKQESLDQGVPFPITDEDFCERCRTVFEDLDFTQGLCKQLAKNAMPFGLRQAVLKDLNGGN